MFVLECKIEIGNLSFDQVVDVKITRSVDLLSDTAVIKLPTTFVLKGTGENQNTQKALKVEDAVRITLGYKGKFSKTEFTGFVTHVKPTTPIEVHCEDAIWKVRQKSCFKNFKDTTLKNILNYIVEGTGVMLSDKVPQMKINNFLLKNDNGAQSLMKLKNYGLTLFLDDSGKLFAGLRQSQGSGKEVTYDLEYNIVKHRLQFKEEKEVKIKLRAKARKPDNTYIEVEVGDKQGQTLEWITHDITSESELKKVAESRLKQMTYDGYEGTVTGFLIPFADRGMSAHIVDERYPEREGRYFIPKIVIHFGSGGARRIVTLGRKVS